MKFMTLIQVFGFVLLLATASAQQFTEPGWYLSTPPAQEEPPAMELLPEGEAGGQAGSLSSGPEIAEVITPEIQALARGLENDPKRIFDWVHDHIAYVHYFGSKKGAQLTLLERSGNDFDQSALLVALLRAAGHPARYQFGLTYMPYDAPDHRDYRHWVGATPPNTNWSQSRTIAFAINDARGFPYRSWFSSTPNLLLFHRIWVVMLWNNTSYWMDPAFKIREFMPAINVATPAGLDTNQLLTVAGGTSATEYVQNLNETSLRNQLRDYTANLSGHLRSNYPNASVAEILGKPPVISSVSATLDQPLPFTLYTHGGAYPLQQWNYIPTSFMAALQVRVDGTNRSLWMPELQGRKLGLTFSTSGLAELWLDDDLLLQKQTSGGNRVEVVLNIDHPHGSWSTNNNTLVNGTFNDHVVTNYYQGTNATYIVAYAFDADREWLRQRQERLDAYRAQGLADTSREVLTETLNVMALNWLLQTRQMTELLAVDQEMLVQYHHRFGRMAQESGRGYYIDVFQQISGMHPANGTLYAVPHLARRDRIFDLETYFGSAAEHALIEQMQSSNLVAASTMKMLQVANANAQRIFLARSSNWTSGANIRSQLTNYTLTSLDTYINNGYTVLLPQNGANFVAGPGSWKGYGLVAQRSDGMKMLISGGYNGGFAALAGSTVDPAVISQINSTQPGYYIPISALAADPVSMADGSFLESKTDCSIGGGKAPRGIEFTRHYSSARRHHNLVGLGQGWTHNYDLRAQDVSAPLAGLGDTTPAQMAPMLVATKAAVALYNTAGPAKNWAVTALIAKWALDQLINNAVSVTLGHESIQFVKQPNGEFTPPAGSTMTLLKTNSAYWLQERHGNTFKFSSAGLLTNIIDQYNQPLTLTYDGTSLSTIKDWKNRTLTLSYSGTPQRLSSVSDATRTISFGYTSSGGKLDLTSVTDPESKTSAFIYDTNHQIVATVNALNQVVTSNRYDGFGRVIEQYSQGDTNQTWRLYWSGFINTEEDPTGARKRYSFDDKYRPTQFQDALGNYTVSSYDGQDHVVRTVSPLNETNRFEYDGRHNLLRSVDALNFTNSFFYDTQDRMVRSVDARGNSSHFGYNIQHRLIGSTNAAGDWLTYSYNSNGTMAARVDADGTTTYSYDSWGQVSSITYPGSLGTEGFLNSSLGDVLSQTNARGFATSFQYSNRRELTNTIAPTNLTAKVAYDAVGNVASATDARGFTSSNAWSATRKLLSTTLPPTPQGTPRITNSYDARDWLRRTVNPLQQATLYTNDAAQRLIGVTDPLLRTTRFSYDAVGRQTAATNAANEVTRQTWNARGELIQTLNPQLATINRGYDAAGNQITLTNRNGKRWQFHFDAANRLTNTVTPLGRETRLSYNNRGLLSTAREPSAQMTTNLYDALGRVTNRVDAVGSTVYRYDGNNNVTNIVEAGRTNVWIFDAYDRAASYKDADGNLIQYAYDQNGNLTNLVYPGGKTVVYAYDSLNRLTNVTDWAARKTGIEYDLASRVRKITRPNGTVREMNYDAAGQTTNIIERTAANIPIAFLKLNWNAAARVEWEFIAPLPHAYTPPTRTMTYDDDNRIAIFNGTGLSYDLDGNLTSGPLTNNTFATYTYDARNRLLSAGALSYAYDALGNRIAITNGATVTKLVVNPNAPLSQVLLRVKNGVTNYYIYGLGLLYEADDAGNTKTYHYDSRGSTIAISDSNGAVTDRVEYSAYGTITYRTGNTDTPFLYNGRYGVQTDDNGLLYMRARYYNPYLCRFLNPDPIGFSGGLNFYAYADGNPISLIDPFGLGAVESGWGSQFAGWIDRNVTDPLNSVSTTSTIANYYAYTAASLVGGTADFFRLGEGTANAIYHARDGWDVAIGIVQDVGRAAGLASLFGGGLQATVTRNTPAVTVYRQGTFADEATGWPGNHVKGRQWATDNPVGTPNYAQRYGLPTENTGRPDWVVGGQTQGSYTTRQAPPSHNNSRNTGGATEILPRNPNDVRLDWFHMPD